MTLETAVNLLKDNNFEAALDEVSGQSLESYTLQHFLVRGLCELALAASPQALITFTKATERFPSHAAFWFNRGVAEENLGRKEAAIKSQEHCLQLNPSYQEAYGNLSNLYRTQKRFTEAESMANRLLALNTSSSGALNCLGLALEAQGKFENAREAFRKARALAPHDPLILSNSANLEVGTLNFEKAWEFFAQIPSPGPAIRQNEALARLLAGDFEKGWPLFEARLELPHALRQKPSCPRWQGENLKGKRLLILAEQGLGDVIQFCRYEKFIEEGELLWSVPQKLVRLLTPYLKGTVHCENDPLPTCDYYLPLLSLPLATRHLGPEPLQNTFSVSSTPLLPSKPKIPAIGLVWKGSPTNERDYERSIPLPLFQPLWRNLKANFYAAFIGEGLEEIGDYPITRLDHLISDFADTAGLLKQMDCLITVDTAVAHLAGSLSLKTYLLLPYCPDWRWGTKGTQTIWYPSVTLIRQDSYGDWQSVIRKLLESGL